MGHMQAQRLDDAVVINGLLVIVQRRKELPFFLECLDLLIAFLDLLSGIFGQHLYHLLQRMRFIQRDDPVRKVV